MPALRQYGHPFLSEAFLVDRAVGQRIALPPIERRRPRGKEESNVSSAGGNIAAMTVAKAPPDLYTLLMASTASLAIQMT